MVAAAGIDDRGSGPGEAADNCPVAPPEGMTTEQLADYQEQFTHWARQRMWVDGMRQYDRGSRQAFEDMDFPTLVVYAQEELADVVNYAAMLAIHLERLKESV